MIGRGSAHIRDRTMAPSRSLPSRMSTGSSATWMGEPCAIIRIRCVDPTW